MNRHDREARAKGSGPDRVQVVETASFDCVRFESVLDPEPIRSGAVLDCLVDVRVAAARVAAATPKVALGS